MKVYIRLTKGYTAIVDREDEPLSNLKWQVFIKKRKNGTVVMYAKRTKNGFLHRMILPGVPRVDHRDGDGLNNSRSNLRAATSSQNMANSKKQGIISTSSRYKGVSIRRDRPSKWVATIIVNGKKIVLGSFRDEADAATVYNFAAEQYFGEFASFNSPLSHEAAL